MVGNMEGGSGTLRIFSPSVAARPQRTSQGGARTGSSSSFLHNGKGFHIPLFPKTALNFVLAIFWDLPNPEGMISGPNSRGLRKKPVAVQDETGAFFCGIGLNEKVETIIDTPRCCFRALKASFDPPYDSCPGQKAAGNVFGMRPFCDTKCELVSPPPPHVTLCRSGQCPANQSINRMGQFYISA